MEAYHEGPKPRYPACINTVNPPYVNSGHSLDEYGAYVPDARPELHFTGNRTGIALGSAYYVNIISSRLANVSSIASTVSMLLMPAAMVLFSYPLSRGFTEDCDRHREFTLPSPYQLRMMIKLVGGQPLALWSYIMYALGSKHKRIDVVPNLSHTVLISTGFLNLT